jgi:serine/threonine protein kinase
MDRALTRQTVDVGREAKRCATCKQRFTRDAGFCPFDGTKLETAPFELATDPLVGTRVDGRYDVVAILGEGGMGRIYEVRHAALGRTFAMKVLRPELAQDADLAARFILEAKATASVKHPNVVQITDFGHLPDGVPFFVMELLVGHTLGDVIKASGPLPPARAVRIVRKVAGALSAAHAAGVVHRDLKPDNVFLVGSARDLATHGASDPGHALALLSSGAEVRVVDFGAAKIVGSTRLTRAGVVFGTPHYMSPEQASDQLVDSRTDVYSLGVIMYEMFCGKVPFESETYMGVLTQHMFERPVLPSEVPGAVGDLGELQAITMRCLAKRPDERFGSMDDLIANLDRVVGLDGEADADTAPPSSTAGVLRSRSLVPPAPQPPTFAEIRRHIDGPEPARPRRGQHRGLYLLYAVLGGLLLVSLGAIRWFLFRNAPVAAALATRPIPAPSAQEAIATGAPLPPAAPSAAPIAPSVGEGASAPTRPSPPPSRHKAPSASELDDVGDPFARH